MHVWGRARVCVCAFVCACAHACSCMPVCVCDSIYICTFLLRHVTMFSVLIIIFTVVCTATCYCPQSYLCMARISVMKSKHDVSLLLPPLLQHTVLYCFVNKMVHTVPGIFDRLTISILFCFIVCASVLLLICLPFLVGNVDLNTTTVFFEKCFWLCILRMNMDACLYIIMYVHEHDRVQVCSQKVCVCVCVCVHLCACACLCVCMRGVCVCVW